MDHFNGLIKHRRIDFETLEKHQNIENMLQNIYTCSTRMCTVQNCLSQGRRVLSSDESACNITAVTYNI